MGNEVSTENQRDLQPGDLIEIFRGSYNHWAVYIGDGFVVHLTSADHAGVSSSGSGQHNKKSVVKKEKLKAVVQDCKWKINNLLDDKYIPREDYVIVKEALSLVGTEQFYSVMLQNCEHFSTSLRYGKGESRQVMQVIEGTLTGTAVGTAAAVVVVGVIAVLKIR